MPYSDVTAALLDPEFAQRIDVIRRSQTVNNYGEAVIGEEWFRGVVAVVTIGGDTGLRREADQQHQGRTLSVVTKFSLRGPAEARASADADGQFQPDLIVWQGGRYVVTGLDPYPNYGAGFVQAICSSMVNVDRAPRTSVNV